MMGAFGSAAVTVFGVIWTISAMSMGAPSFFALFGLIFIIMGIAQTVYNFKNATSKNRYSAFDITDGAEEPDPLNAHFAGLQTGDASEDAGKEKELEATAAAFCPYCGAEVEADFTYCTKCGKKLPE
jgi:hypothetical protein